MIFFGGREVDALKVDLFYALPFKGTLVIRKLHIRNCFKIFNMQAFFSIPIFQMYQYIYLFFKMR